MLELVIYAGAMRCLVTVVQVFLLVGQPVQPLECALDLDVAKAGACELNTLFVLIGFRDFFCVDVCFE